MRKFFAKKRNFLLPFILLLASSATFSRFDNNQSIVSEKNNLYHQLQLSQLGLGEEVFEEAITGWETLSGKRQIEKLNILSIADLSQSSNSKRLYVIDIEQKKVLFNTYVAHGRNSGEKYALSFSNDPDSYKSSLGFYLTENTYEGTHGLSMKLKGIEKGFNDMAEQRGIVLHGAPYVSEQFINEYGRLGRSQGCPAVPEELCKPIINSIKDGSCFFIFYPDSGYLRKSVL